MMWLLLFAFLALGNGETNEITPEYLDQLLAERRYEEFSKHMGIEDPKYVRPDLESEDEPMFNAELHEGDIMLTAQEKEQQRQGIRFDKYPESRWPNEEGKPVFIPVFISNAFSPGDRFTIINTINFWNTHDLCVKFIFRNTERDYIHIFPGWGCWSFLGRVGGQQALSLGWGCVRNGIIMHELNHAVGFHHEHNRHDRDDYVEVLWDNIPRYWHRQYQKTNPDQFGLQSTYDYYSIMHYPMRAPGTGRDAFRIKKDGINRNKLGAANTFTCTDQEKIRILYNCTA